MQGTFYYNCSAFETRVHEKQQAEYEKAINGNGRGKSICIAYLCEQRLKTYIAYD